MPVHILIECPELIVSARLGVVEPLKPLERQGKCQLLFLNTIDIRKKHILWADIVITVRGCETLSAKLVASAKKASRLIIYYLDDDLLHIPEESSAWEYYNDPILQSDLIGMLALSDILWGVNSHIRDIYLPYTHGRWIENRLPFFYTGVTTRVEKQGPVQILYAGSSDHQILVEDILSPVVRRLLEEYGEQVAFTFIGADPKLNEYSQVRYIPFITPYEAYRNFVEKNSFSIGLAPGRYSSFYACKYYNKFIEYTSIGAVGIYTNAEPYTQIVRDGENGILCENTLEGWYVGIRRLLDDPILSAKCRDRAVEQLQTEFNATAVAEQLEIQCPEFSSYHAPTVSRHLVKFVGGPLFFYYDRAMMLWRSRGISGLPVIFFKAAKVICKRLLERIGSIVHGLF